MSASAAAVRKKRAAEVIRGAVESGATLTVTGARNEFGGQHVRGELESASGARYASASAGDLESCLDMLADQWDSGPRNT